MSKELQELTNKIKKIIPEKDASYMGYMGEEFEFILTLEDVLRCIGEMEDQNKLGDYIIGGQFFTILNNEADDYEELFSWKLGNPLHEQSEETIKELNKLI